LKSDGGYIDNGRTVHRNWAILFCEGNKKECRFQTKLNDRDTIGWQPDGEILLKPLSEGLQSVVINCKYIGGTQIVSKTISFTVAAKDYVPKFDSEGESLISADSLLPVTLSASVSGLAPISFQWYKNNEILNGQTQSVLLIEHFSREYAGDYYCVAGNEYDTVKGPLLTVVLKTTFTITYNGNGNTSGDVPFDATYYLSGKTITVKDNVKNLVKTGFNFAGWSTNIDGNGTIYSPGAEITNIASNVLLYARWSKTRDYNVIYKENGATSGYAPVDENSYDSGTVLTVKGNAGGLKKDGYTFVGWNTASNGNGIHYNPDTRLTIQDATVILYAKWTQRSAYNISYDGNGNTGGTVPVDLNNYEEGSKAVIRENTNELVNAGFSFTGWNTRADGNGESYAEGAEIQVLSSNVTLYAKWTERETFTITYDGNGNTSGKPPVDNNRYEENSTAVLKQNESGLTRIGYRFKGWCTDKDGNGKKYAPSDTVPILGSTVLFAIWNQIITCSVVYSGNGNTSGSVPIDTMQHEDGSSVLVLANYGGLKKDNSVFAGWNTDSEGNGLHVYPGSLIKVDSSVTLYAYWTQNTTHSVTYKANGSTSGTPPVDSNRYVNGASATVQLNSGNLVKSGYSFIGWNTEPDGSGILYATGVSFTVTSDVTLYAKWTVKETFTVAYNGNSNTSGSVPVDANAYETGNVVIIKGNTGNLLRDGYNFTGWNENADGSGTAYAPNSEMKIDKNSVILYAVWTRITIETFKITYNGNSNTGGSVPVDNALYTKGAKATIVSNLGALVKAGYSFAGWSTDIQGSTNSIFIPGNQIAVTKDVVLFAFWSNEKTYKVIYSSNGSTSGALPKDENVYLPGVTVTVKGNSGNLEKSGSTFSGWNTRSDGTGVSYFENDTLPKKAKEDTLYAKWSQNPTYTVTYYSNNATTGSVPIDANLYEAGVTITIKNNVGNLYRSEYSFGGWNTRSDGTGIIYTGGASLVMKSENLTLYADWQKIPTYSIIYDGNGNTSGSVPVDNAKYQALQEVTVKDNLGLLGKDNLNFSGWNTQADGTGISYAAGSKFKTGNSDVVLYAVWTSNPTYTVAYNANGATNGNIPTDYNKYKQGDNVKVMENVGGLAKTGYTFEGWNTSSTGSGNFYSPGAQFTMGSGNVALWAVWVPYFTINYTGNGNTYGSSPTDAIKYQKGQVAKIQGKNNLQKDGFTFSNWNTLYNAKGKFYKQNDTLIIGSNSIQLHAAWMATINFDGQGATSGPNITSSSIYHPDTLLLSFPINPSKAGSSFAGWYTAVNGGTQFTASTKITGSATVYAHWNINRYTINYNGNNSTGGTAPAGGTYDYNVIVSAASNTFTRDGYRFTGWNTAANGTGTSYSEDASITVTASITLYAQWSRLTTYTVSYAGNGNTSGSAPVDNAQYTSGQSATALGAGTLVKNGSSFAGWNTSENGNGTSYAEGASIPITGNITLYAKWALITTYTVTYNGNNNSGGTVPIDNNNYTSGQTASVADPGTLVREGFTFVGWNTLANGTGTNYAAGVSLNVTSNATLYAKWLSISTYKVTYDGNNNTGGTVPVDNNNYTSGETAAVANSGTLVREGYTFVGWNTLANGTGTNYAAGVSLNVTSNVTLYAKWAIISAYTVTYDGNNNTGGTAPVDNNTYISGQTATLAACGSLVRTEYTFDGWNTLANGNGITYAAGGILPVTENVTLYAKWKAITYSLTYFGNGNASGDVPVDNNSYQAGGVVIVSDNTGALRKPDSTFDGWSKVAGIGKIYRANDTLLVGTTNISLYVRWKTIPRYSIKYDGNGNNGGTVPVDPKTYLTGESITVSDNTGQLTKANSTFGGWTPIEGAGKVYGPGDTLIVGNDNIKLYTHWLVVPELRRE
jgi:uncharacterized repeat protein (TIGR02543 family)